MAVSITRLHIAAKVPSVRTTASTTIPSSLTSHIQGRWQSFDLGTVQITNIKCKSSRYLRAPSWSGRACGLTRTCTPCCIPPIIAWLEQSFSLIVRGDPLGHGDGRRLKWMLGNVRLHSTALKLYLPSHAKSSTSTEVPPSSRPCPPWLKGILIVHDINSPHAPLPLRTTEPPIPPATTMRKWEKFSIRMIDLA